MLLVLRIIAILSLDLVCALANKNKSADFRHTQSWLTTSHNNPMRKSAPYGTHSRIIILARSLVEVVIQTAIELICKGAILRRILHRKISHISLIGKRII